MAKARCYSATMQGGGRAYVGQFGSSVLPIPTSCVVLAATGCWAGGGFWLADYSDGMKGTPGCSGGSLDSAVDGRGGLVERIVVSSGQSTTVAV